MENSFAMEMEDNLRSRGVSSCLPLNPKSYKKPSENVASADEESKNFENSASINAGNVQKRIKKQKLFANNNYQLFSPVANCDFDEIYLQRIGNAEEPPSDSRPPPQEIPIPPQCQNPQAPSVQHEIQMPSQCFNCGEMQNANFPHYRNNFATLPFYHPSHHPHQVNRPGSHAELSHGHGEYRGDMSDTDESCGKQSVWRNICSLFTGVQRSKFHHQRHFGSLEFNDVTLHGLKNAKQFRIDGIDQNVLKISAMLPNMMVTSKYEMNNWGKLSAPRTSGKGEMELTLQNVRVKMTVPFIEERIDGVKRKKSFNPIIKIELKGGHIHFSDMNGFKNKQFNKNFLKTYKMLEPSLLEHVKRKAVEKLDPMLNNFSNSI